MAATTIWARSCWARTRRSWATCITCSATQTRCMCGWARPIVRLQYNGETRDRLDREAEMRRLHPPRGSLLVSAEIGPSAASASQRTLLVPFHPGEISRETRIALWEPESRHGRAAALRSEEHTSELQSLR